MLGNKRIAHTIHDHLVAGLLLVCMAGIGESAYAQDVQATSSVVTIEPVDPSNAARVINEAGGTYEFDVVYEFFPTNATFFRGRRRVELGFSGGRLLPPGTALGNDPRVTPTQDYSVSVEGVEQTLTATRPTRPGLTYELPFGSIEFGSGLIMEPLPADRRLTRRIVLTAKDDDVDEGPNTAPGVGNEFIMLVFNPQNPDGMVAAPDVGITYTPFRSPILILDDDTNPPGVTVTPTSLTTTEGGMATFTVVLDTEPAGFEVHQIPRPFPLPDVTGSMVPVFELTNEVRVTVTSTDPSDGGLVSSVGTTPAISTVLTFTDDGGATPWDTPQSVTVNGADNLVSGSDTTYDITFGVDGGTFTPGSLSRPDNDYDGVTVAAVSVTNTDNDGMHGVIVTETGGSTIVAENGGTDTFTVALRSEPANDVVLTLTSSDTNEGTVTPATLTFTRTGGTTPWNTPQTVTLTGVNDNVDRDGDSFTVDFAITDEGGTNYPITPSAPVLTVTATDDDNASTNITLAISPTNVAETADNTTITITATLGGTVVLGTPTNITVTPAGESSFTLTIPALSLSATRTFGIDPVADANTNDETINISGTASGFSVAGATLTIRDAGLSVFQGATGGMPISLTTGATEGIAHTFYVRLTRAPTGNVVVVPTSRNPTELAINTPSLTFNTMNWNMRQPVMVTGFDDDVFRTDSETVTATDRIHRVDFAVTTGDGNIYPNDLPLASVDVRVTDDDEVTLVLSAFPTDIPEDAGPTTVTVTAMVMGSTRVSRQIVQSVNLQGSGPPVPGTSTQANATLQATAERDAIVTSPTTNCGADCLGFGSITIPPFGDSSGTITFTIDPLTDTRDEGRERLRVQGAGFGYGVDSVTQAEIFIVESGVLAFEALTGGTSIDAVTIAEASGSDILYVQLASQPAGDVTLSVTSSDTDEGTVNVAALTFTNADWDTRKPVTVTAVNDDIDRDDSFTVDFVITATGDTGNYPTNLGIPSVTVTVTDDDAVGIALFEESTSGAGSTAVTTITTGETAGTGNVATFYVELTSQPTGPVTVTIDGIIATEHTLTTPASGTLTFTPTGGTAWNTRQAITLTGVDDDFVDDDQMYNLTLTPTGGGYDSVTPAIVPITNTDDDTAGLAIDDLMVDEDAGTATVTVTLTPAVTAGTVTVDATTMDGTATTAGTDYTAITSQTLTFVAGNTSQTLDIPINDDSIAEGNENFTVVLSNLMPPTGITTVSIADATATVTIIDDDVAIPALTVVASGSDTTTSENLTDDTFTVALAAQPPTDVTVTISGLDATEHTLTPSTTLTFTNLNWDTVQTITLTGVNDDVVDGDQTYDLTLSASGGGYGGVTQTVSVTNEDNDTPALTIVASGSDTTTSENLTDDTFTVALAAQPPTDVTVTISGLDATEHTLTPSTTLTFTNLNWDTVQTITLTGVNDDVIDGDQTYDLTLSASGGGYGGVTQTVSVTNEDNDVAALTIVASGSDTTTSENLTDDTFTVALAAQPPTDVTVTISGLDATEHTLTPSTTLTFTNLNWDTVQTITLTGVNDDVVDGDQTYDLTLSASGGGYGGVTQTVSVTNEDNDTPALTIVASGSDTTTSENLTDDTFTVALATQPPTDVTVTISGLDATEHTLTPSTTLTFTNLNWDTVQTITLTGVNDDVIDGDQTYDLTLSASGGGYGGVTQTVSVTNEDNDTPALTIVASGSDTTTSENLTDDTFTVALATQPPTDVTVTISGLDATEHTLTPSTTLTFTNLNWDTVQTITLTGVNDDVVDGDQTYDLTLSASGGGYGGVTQTVSVTNEDNDVAALTIVASGSDTTTSENLTDDTFTVALATQPPTDVTVTISGLDATEHTLTPSTTLTFTNLNWDTVQTITLTGVNDDVVDGDQTYDLTLSASGGGYGGVTQTVSVTNEDNDVAALTIVASGSDTTTSENLTDDTFTVALATQPPTDVTVTISGLDATEHTLTPSTTLTFTNLNWDTVQTITLTGVNDDVVDGDQTYDLTLSASGGGYGGVTQTVSVTNEDNDVAALTIVASGSDTTTSENLTDDTFTVALAAQPPTDVTVTISGLDATEHTLTPSTTLTFTNLNWDTVQTITLTGVNDDVVDGDQTYDLTLSASGGGYGGVTQTVSVTNEDNDVAALTIVASGSDTTTSENLTDDTFTVALATQPPTDVTVTISGLDATEHTLTPSTTLTFTNLNWDTVQTITLTGVNDDVIDGDQTYDLTLSASGGGYGGVTQTVSVTNTDNDTPALTIVASGSDTTTSENLTDDTFTVALATQPPTDVTVTISGLDATEHTLTPSTTLTFTNLNWDTVQTITLTGVNDDVVDGDQTYDLTLSASGGGYGGVTQTVSVTNTDNDTPALTIVASGSDTTTSENLTDDTFTVALATQPPTDVTVTISGLDATEHTLTPSTTLTFTNLNWDTVQTITLTGVNDDVVDGDQTYDLTLSASGGGYGGVTQTVSVTNEDNDVAALTIVASGSDTTTSENLTDDTFTVALATQPPTDVTVTISGLDATEHTLTPSTTLTFTNLNWDTVQTITLTGVNDDVVDGDQTYDLTLSASGGGYGGVTQTVSVTNEDNDVAALTIVASGSDTTTSENLTDDTFTVALATQPPTDVTVTISGLDATEHTLTPSTTLTFTNLNWDTVQTITLTGVNDDVIDGDQTYDLTLSASGGGYGGVTQTVSVTNTDNDTPALTIVASGSDTTTSENLTDDTFTVALATQPPTDVTVTISGLDATEHTLTPSTTLTFTNLNWDTVQTITLTGVNDDVIDGDQTYDLTLSASGGGYGGVTQTVSVTNTDNDTPALTVVASGSDTTTSENLTDDTFTVALATQPPTDVTVTISGLDATEHTLTPSTTLTFTNLNWDTVQTITLTGVNDDVVDGDQTYDLTLSASGGGYGGVTQTVSVTNTDNDTPALTIVASGSDTTTSENLTDDTFTVALATQPPTDVTVTISGLDATEHTLTPSTTLTFTNLNWDTVQTITLTGVNDDVIDGDQTYDLTLSASGGGYGGVTQTVSVTNTDNDTPALTIVASGSDTTTSENLTDDTFTVALATQPPTDVTVTISGLDATEHTLTPSTTLTFTNLNWDTVQTITLTGVNDDVVDGDQTYDLTLSASGGGYGGVTQTVSVTNEDNDTPALTIVASGSDTTTSENLTDDTFTVALATQPPTDVTVTISGLDATEHTLTPSTTLTFTNLNWDTVQTITLTGVNDDVVDGDQTYDLTLSASGGGYGGVTQTVSVTNEDNDVAALTIVASGSDTTTSENLTDDTFTVALATQPPTDVTVTISGLDATEHTLTPSTTLTFTNLNWDTVQTITLTGVNDDVVDGDQTYDLTLSASGGGYGGVTQTVSVTNEDNDVAALTIVASGSDTTTSENLTDDTFTVALAAQPPTDVTVTISGLDATEHTLTPSTTLTFTNLNWDTVQTITLTGVNDDVVDGDQTYDLTLSASGGGYGGVTQTVSVTNEDNDVAALTIVASGSDTTTSENLTDDTFTVALATQPPTDVTVTISGLDATEHTLTPSTTLTFTNLNWDTVQTITLTGVNDDVIDGDQTYDLTLSASGGGYGGVTQTVSVTNEDNDTPALTIVASGSDTTTSENLTDDTFTVALATQPPTDVTVTISGLDATEHTLTPSTTLTFTNLNWDTVQTITLTGVNDDVVDGDQTYDLTLSASGGGYGGVTQTVSVTNEDNDTPALTIVASGSDTTTSENLTDDTFTVALATQPPTDVTVTISGLDATEHTLTPSTTLTFTNLNWDTVQTITLTGVNDDVVDGDQTYDLTLSASGGGYGGVTQTVSVTNTDNDTPALTIVASGSDTTTSENLTDDTFTVALATQPPTDVTVTISGLDATEHTLTPSTTLTFTNLNWDTVQTITLTGVNDDVIDGDQTYDLTLSASGGGYGGVTQTVSVTNEDNDTPALTIVASGSDTTTSENLTDDTFTVALATQPPTDVTVTISGLDATEHTLTPSTTLTFTNLNWDTVQTITLTGVNDDVVDGDQTYDLTLSASGGGYGGVTQTVSVTNTDNDVIEGLNTQQREALHGQLLSVANQATMQVMVDVLSKRLTPRARTEAHGSVAGHVLGLQEWQTVDWQKRLSLVVYSTLQRLDDGGALLVPVDATTFNNSEFVLPLPVGESVVVLWGALGSSTVKGGQSDASDYDGDLIAVLLGIDSMIGEHARLGIAASYEHSELDYQLDMTNGDAVQTMTSIQPYLSWQPHDSVALWLIGGYGFGDYDATESTAGGTTLRAEDADVERWMAAMGFHYTHRFGSSGWDMVLNNKALWNRTVRDATRFDDGSLLPRNVSENWRARLESEVGYSWTFGDGSVRPYGLASVRWDGGDVVNDDTTFMVDAGGGVELAFASRLSMDFKVRRQVTDGDHEEHSVVAVGSFGFAEHEDGQGWQVALERSLLGGLSAPEHNKAGFDFEQGDSTPTIGQSPSLQANVGYGRLINPLADTKAGLLKTYTRFYLDPDENKRHAVGLGFDFASLQLGVESEYNNGEFETLLRGHIDF